jgi:tetratricopeptide (TPR) repeat protein
MTNEPQDSAVSIDPQHPWLGLSSYTEETRAYFHGRDDEAAELARRVQRKNLTVLFGQSGLGKTSLLRAGLVPRLRGEGFCPVYVRVDYSPESPPPAEQIKQAVFKATVAAGHWTRPGTAIEGESLWEFLHHRGDLLRDSSGRTLLPLLIFDQFEEIFTLAQADDRGRLRAREFIEELADLVENRPPLALERRLEHDDAAADDFDFARADYRILIALREDYLAHLESLKGTMPSITQNRMRLARMTGAQALSAVMKPGGRLVSQEVAESIVRFVAGGSELANAEVEPSLLSLVCRELNNLRIAKGRAEISADLLAGSRDTILTEFYERALEDQPPGVRRVVEDELLTESGYRESLAEERVIKALAAAGAAPDSLAKLVDRRLLRIEERLDVRRVELTHDVLCNVVRASRDLRHEREARDEAERQLAAQREREAETRRTLRRTRRVAVVSAVLMLVALASSIFGWINYRRAHQADVAAQQARGDAEQLVGFLIEDFYAELEPTGRVETMGKLAQKAVDYYDGLPPELLTPRTRAYRGMALVRLASVAYARNDREAADQHIKEAQTLFEQLRAEGDDSESSAVGLALALFTPTAAVGPGALGDTGDELRRAAELLRPFATATSGSTQAKITYADVLNNLSHDLPKEDAVATCEEARQVLAGVGAKDLSNLTAASVYADTADSQARHAMALGRLEDAARLEQEVYELAEKVLAERPGDLRSMRNRALAADLLGVLADRRHDYAAAEEFATKAERAGEDYVRFNPSDMTAWNYWVRGKEQMGSVLFEQGRITEAQAAFRSAVALDQDPRRPASLGVLMPQTWRMVAANEARMGRRAAALAALEASERAHQEQVAMLAEGSARRELMIRAMPAWPARLQLLLGDFTPAFGLSNEVLARLREVEIAADDRFAKLTRDNVSRFALATSALAALRLGRYAEAEAASRERLAVPPNVNGDADPQDEKSRATVLLAHAIAAQGRGAEALGLVAPILDGYRAEQKAGASGTTFQRDLAYALFVEAIAQPADAAGRARRNAALAAAEQEFDALSDEAQQMSDFRELGALIRRERGAPAG